MLFGRRRPDAGGTHVGGDVGTAKTRRNSESSPGTPTAICRRMSNKAPSAGRPIHPMLVGFPIVLFVGTIGLELAHVGTQNAFYFRTAMFANIAGVMMALLAVIPAAIDLAALPAGSEQRATAVKHAVLNALTVAVFTISAMLLVRGYIAGTPDAHLPIALGMIGIVAMTYAGALGYALARNLHVRTRPSFAPRTFGTAFRH